MPLSAGLDSNQTLNQVLIALHRSLPLYLGFADPWVDHDKQEAQVVLSRLVADNQDQVARLTALLDARRHTIDLGEFPMDFTGLHDVSLEFLIKQLIEDQKRDVRTIETSLSRITGDADGRALVEEILKSSRRNLLALEDLSRQPAGANAER